MVPKPVEIRTRKRDNPRTIQQRYIHMVPKPVETRTHKETILIQYKSDTYTWYLSQ